MIDLYAMGMLDRSQVPPTFLIEGAAGDASRLPELGVTLSGTPSAARGAISGSSFVSSSMSSPISRRSIFSRLVMTTFRFMTFGSMTCRLQ